MSTKKTIEEKTQALHIGSVSGGFSAEHNYRLHLDRMKFEICELVNDCFYPKADPEIQWKFFREQLSHYKREQVLKWLETDAD